MLHDLYYALKPIVPRRLQLEARRKYIAWRMAGNGHHWPIDPEAGKKPAGWQGWPGGKRFALVLTHDVERAEGQSRCHELMQLEKSMGFRSAFNFVAEDYTADMQLRRRLVEEGFEIGLHGVTHEGNIFKSEQVFHDEAARINRYLKDWNCKGFRSPRMYHDLKLAHGLDIEYDASTFDTDPFEPQPDGVRTIFPFFVRNGGPDTGYVELPYTLPQDHLLFVLMGHKDIGLWKEKLRWIAEHGGMALIITHPDYMSFGQINGNVEQYPAAYYREFLEHIRTEYEGQYWQALPREVAAYCREARAVSAPALSISEPSVGAAIDIGTVAATRQESRKACFLYYHRFKGTAILYREAKALKDKGFDVDIVCLRDSEEENVFQHYEDMNLYCIQARPEREKKASSYFLKLFTFCVKSTALLSWLGLKKRYDVIHVTSPPDFLVFSTLIPKLLGARVILDIHDIGPELCMRKLDKPESDPTVRMLKWLEKISARFADHVITVTDLWKDKLSNRSVPASKCTSILNVPDDHLFKAYAPTDREKSNGHRLSYHGSLEEHFGVDILLEAMPAIKAQVPDIELVIYGMGRLRDAYEDRIREKNMGDYVRINDFVPFYTLPEVLKEASIGIVPTKADLFSGEALSMKALEYMALGIPVVVSQTPVHRYYYDDSMVKFFAPGNSEDLARVVVELHRDESARRRLAENAKGFIETHGWKAERERYYDIVDRLTNGKQ